jgi:hypothetical protein
VPRRRRQPSLTVERHPDDLPKRGLFAEPIRLTRLDALDPETTDDGQQRAVFLLEVRDAEDRRCSEISVAVEVHGPERSSTVQGTTDLLGRLRVRMAGPAGTYRIEVQDVGAFGLDWDVAAGPRVAETELH